MRKRPTPMQLRTKQNPKRLKSLRSRRDFDLYLNELYRVSRSELLSVCEAYRLASEDLQNDTINLYNKLTEKFHDFINIIDNSYESGLMITQVYTKTIEHIECVTQIFQELLSLQTRMFISDFDTYFTENIENNLEFIPDGNALSKLNLIKIDSFSKAKQYVQMYNEVVTDTMLEQAGIILDLTYTHMVRICSNHPERFSLPTLDKLPSEYYKEGVLLKLCEEEIETSDELKVEEINKIKNIFDYKELNRIAKDKGFTYTRSKGDHAIFHDSNGNSITIPQGRSIGKGLSRKIQKQIHNKDNFSHE